ncbi:MAG TPA: histidine kinase, partial [Rhodothermales bacterium]|nr:histidine kinase [Rhodothermales bacterium]
AVATMAFVVGKFALFVPMINAIYADERAQTLGDALARSFVVENVAFWCVLGVVLAIEYHRRMRAREVQAARLAAELSDARLEALAAQLHPHFLFNTLQGISTLLHRDPQSADAMLQRLSELLRRTLRRDGAHEIPLREEIELLELYLGVVQTRFADRLRVSIHMPPELQDALTPHFLLQPLVENALQHGIARRAGAGHVEVRAVREGDTLVLQVTDDGPGLSGGSRQFPQEGIGLANTRRRLVQLYGSKQSLTLAPAPGGGLTVTARLPWHVAPMPEPVPA